MPLVTFLGPVIVSYGSLSMGCKAGREVVKGFLTETATGSNPDHQPRVNLFYTGKKEINRQQQNEMVCALKPRRNIPHFCPSSTAVILDQKQVGSLLAQKTNGGNADFR